MTTRSTQDRSSFVPFFVVPFLVVPLFLSACGSSSNASVSSSEGGGCSDRPSRPDETLISLDTSSKFEVEPSLAARANDLVIAWEASSCDDRTRIGYTRRRSAGVAFDAPQYLTSPNGQEASNVTVALDTSSSLYATWASWSRTVDAATDGGPIVVHPTDIRIQFARWPAGATGFEAPRELSEPVTTPLNDKPWTIVTADDTIVVTYGDLGRGGILAASSIDGGATFRRSIVDPSGTNLAASCADGRPGGAFATYYASATIRVAHTTDGGLAWSTPITVAVADASGGIAYQDSTCVANGDDVWITYARSFDSTLVDVQRLVTVRVAHAILGATVPDTDVVALDAASISEDPSADDGGTLGFLLFPQMAQRTDGAFGVAAYRARNEATGAADLVYVVSTDGGHSFGSPTTVATDLTPSLARHVPNWLGDYFGWGTVGNDLHAAFVDNASGLSHVAYR